MKRFLITLTVAILTVISPGTAQAAIQQDKNAAVLDHPLYDPKDYGTACPVGGSGGPLTGNDNAEKIFLYFTGKGLTAAQAAGIMGNFQQESGFDPAIIQGGEIAGPNYIPVNGVGFGLAQWTFTSRQAPLQQMARDTNRPIIDLSLQLEYVWAELNGTHLHALLSLKGTTTPERAAYVFHRDYEGSADSEEFVNAVRGGNAREIYEKYKHLAPLKLPAPLPLPGLTPTPSPGSTPSPTQQPSTGSAACPTTGGGTGGLSNFLEGDFTIYNQCAYPPYGGAWGNLLTPWGQTMCSSACGPTSLAMVARNMTGAQITPLETINYYTTKGYWVPGGGSFISALGQAGDAFGLRTEPIANKGDINAYTDVFAKGGLVIVASRGTSPFLSQGHAIVLRGIQDGKFMIADPGYKETNVYPANMFDTNKILSDIRADGYSAAFAYYKK